MEVKARVTIDYRPETVNRAVDKGMYRSLSHAAASIRRTAIQSIVRRKDASEPGTPPHTHTGLLRRAILYFVDRGRQWAIIGPAASVVGEAGEAHEYGGQYKKERFKKRPFMGPALLQSQGRLPDHWRDSVRG